MAVPGVRKPSFVFKELHIYAPYPNTSIKNINCSHRVKHNLSCAIATIWISSDCHNEANVDNSHKELEYYFGYIGTTPWRKSRIKLASMPILDQSDCTSNYKEQILGLKYDITKPPSIHFVYIYLFYIIN